MFPYPRHSLLVSIALTGGSSETPDTLCAYQLHTINGRSRCLTAIPGVAPTGVLTQLSKNPRKAG